MFSFFPSVRPKILPFTFGEDEFHTPGSHVQTICIVGEGDLPIELTWTFRGDSKIGMADMGVSTTRVGPRSSVLQIDSVTAAHSGEYTCTAKNSVGSQSVVADLEVLGIIIPNELQFRSALKNLNVKRLRPFYS